MKKFEDSPAVEEMIKYLHNIKVKLRETQLYVDAANKDGDAYFCKRFTNMPKLGLQQVEKTGVSVENL